MTKKKFSCNECDAYGTITYDLDTEFYQINSCPFCSAELSSTKDTEEDDE